MVEAKPGPWQYHSEVLTDQAPEEVCANIVREKLLEYLNQEIPYSMTQVAALQSIASLITSSYECTFLQKQGNGF